MNIVNVILLAGVLALLFNRSLRKAAATILLGLALLFYGQPILNAILQAGQWLISLALGGSHG
jgi:Na+/phosphate symporter